MGRGRHVTTETSSSTYILRATFIPPTSKCMTANPNTVSAQPTAAGYNYFHLLSPLPPPSLEPARHLHLYQAV
ncbi:hypothetical protein E2C01_057268 [Portunus trituberculatus]|uniref:Uncharacterized protein n=1 Tax=Portunus trituberculatus TaxID=210409 RepID=A0A5B7H0L3_PORTR|nr:hypothetical protein [Portunus trituberculatus]